MPKSPLRIILLALLTALPLLYSCGTPEDTSDSTSLNNTQGPRSLQGLAWKFQADGEIASSPVVAGGLVYAGSDDAHLYALDASTGQVRWKLKTGDSVHPSPVVQGGVVYAGSANGALYSVDAQTGVELWKSKTYGYFILLDKKGICCEDYLKTNLPPALPKAEMYQMSRSGSSGYGVYGSPLITDDMAFFGGEDNYFYAASLATGEASWVSKAPSDILSTPAADKDSVYFVDNGGTLFSMQTKTGRENWRFHTLGFFSNSPLVVADGLIYLSGNRYPPELNYGSGRLIGTLWAVDAASGKEKWEIRHDPYARSPALAQGKVYFSVESRLHAVSAATGKELWALDTGSDIVTSPSLAGDVVYIGNSNRYIYAVDAATGREQWRFQAEDEITSDLAIGKEMVYFACNDSSICALK